MLCTFYIALHFIWYELYSICMHICVYMYVSQYLFFLVNIKYILDNLPSMSQMWMVKQIQPSVLTEGVILRPDMWLSITLISCNCRHDNVC